VEKKFREFKRRRSSLLKARVFSVLILSTLLVYSSATLSADFYVDPIRGHHDNDGSFEKPWPSLNFVFQNKLIKSQNWSKIPFVTSSRLQIKNPDGIVNGGDTIWLKEGDYGTLSISGFYNTETITIKSLPGDVAKFKGINIVSSAHWTFSGLLIENEYEKGKTQKNLIRLTSHKIKGPLSNVSIINSTVRSTESISEWTKHDWLTKAANGINVNGNNVSLINNRIVNIQFGVILRGERGLVSENVIENFSGDGIRGLGDYGVYEYNLVKNNYAVDQNHDDAFQSWSTGPNGSGDGIVKGIVLRGNTFINNEDQNQKFKGPLQGIGAFDGMFEDWVIENNVIMVNSWHGIALVGAVGCRILNNTVVRLNLSFKKMTWITVRDHKNGTPSKNCVIRNNITNSLKILASGRMVVDHNISDLYPHKMFKEFYGFDLRLNKGAVAIDSGSNELAPIVDITGFVRNDGRADMGAYEYRK